MLVLDDSVDDTKALVAEFVRAGYAVRWRRVSDRAGFVTALCRSRWDVVLADYQTAGLHAGNALRLLRRLGLDLPFIIVSGTVGEDYAARAMRGGVHDYLVKGHLARLVPAVERELHAVRLRQQRREMQEQLLLSGQMASIGMVAAGVAHDLRTPLMALMGNLDVIAAELAALRERSNAVDDLFSSEELQEMEEALRDARDAAVQMSAIVRDLRLFSRPDEESREAVDIHRVIESSIRLAWTEIRYRAKLVKEFGQVPPVMGNSFRIGQVILNLLVNAGQAIEAGAPESNEVRIVTRAEGDEVIIEVHDTGVGIDPQHLDRIFEPMFTTKPVGEGTGLGLAICKRIVRSLDGRIEVRSKPGEGSTFLVALPMATRAPGSQSGLSIIPETRRGRVLVVDDEPLIGRAIMRMLSRRYEVEAVTRAADALERIVGGETFDALVCDVHMPGMTGLDFYRALLDQAPDYARRLVFMTGGAVDPADREFLERISNPRIEKPVDTRTLVKTLQALTR